MDITLPADADTERLAHKLAEAMGLPLSKVVKQAIEAEAAKAGVGVPARLAGEELLARMLRVTDGFAGLPVLDPRPADEIAAYDESGVAR